MARLRGVKYFTWEDSEKFEQEDQVRKNNKLNTTKNFLFVLKGPVKEGGEAHAKFTNYSFDVEEFVRIVEKAVRHVKNHPKFNDIVSSIPADVHDEL